MYDKLSDEEFYEEVIRLLDICCKKCQVQVLMEEWFNKSYSSVRKRFKRMSSTTISRAHNEMLIEKATELLKEKPCFEVMIEIGFKYESNFTRWYRNGTGVVPSDCQD